MLPAVNTRPSSRPDRQSRPGLAGVVLRYPVMPQPEDWLLERVYSGRGPAFSEVLGAWLVPDGRLLAIADDPEGLRRW